MSGEGHNSAGEQLRLLIERIETLEEEKKGIADDITAIAPRALTNFLKEIIQVIIEPNGENRLHVLQCHTSRALSSDVELYGPNETSSATAHGSAHCGLGFWHQRYPCALIQCPLGACPLGVSLSEQGIACPLGLPRTVPFKICEYGRQPKPEEIKVLFPFIP